MKFNISAIWHRSKPRTVMRLKLHSMISFTISILHSLPFGISRYTMLLMSFIFISSTRSLPVLSMVLRNFKPVFKRQSYLIVERKFSIADLLHDLMLPMNLKNVEYNEEMMCLIFNLVSNLYQLKYSAGWRIAEWIRRI